MGGMQPMTPASENSGIASGMMPEPPPPEGMQAMQQMASLKQIKSLGYSYLNNLKEKMMKLNKTKPDHEKQQGYIPIIITRDVSRAYYLLAVETPEENCIGVWSLKHNK